MEKKAENKVRDGDFRLNFTLYANFYISESNSVSVRFLKTI